MDSIQAFFVYGTLKRGQLRGGLWPRQPIQVHDACIEARLYDLGPYPAISNGNDLVLGQIWMFRNEDMSETIRVLDRIEDYDPLSHHNEYTRQTVRVIYYPLRTQPLQAEFQSEQAFAYFAAGPEVLRSARYIEASSQWNERRVAVWPDAQSRVALSVDEERSVQAVRSVAETTSSQTDRTVG